MARPRALLALALAAALAGACADRLAVDGERALGRVRHQCDAGPRISGTPGNAAIREWIAAECARLGGRVERQAFTDTTLGRPLEVTNVIARFGPAAGRRVVLCAHFDTRPWCDRDPDSTMRSRPVPGANDGGSGVAVLLEVAELMSRRAPPVGVDLVFFDAEDLGRDDAPEEFSLGSKGYAERLPAQGDPARPVAAFLFDMVGDRDLQVFVELTSSRRAANLAALVVEAARATGARSFHDEVRHNLVDDHVRLLDAGLPAVDVVDFDYPAWHTHRDTPDQVSAASLAEVARVAAWLVYRSPLARPGGN
jgi:glutaminyl-peptide cyclotransferase